MTNAIEVLEQELRQSIHFSKYPQDRHKDKPQEIKVLIQTSEYHSKLADEFKRAIAILASAKTS